MLLIKLCRTSDTGPVLNEGSISYLCTRSSTAESSKILATDSMIKLCCDRCFTLLLPSDRGESISDSLIGEFSRTLKPWPSLRLGFHLF